MDTQELVKWAPTLGLRVEFDNLIIETSTKIERLCPVEAEVLIAVEI